MPLQATSGAASYDAFGGGVPVVPTYIEDVMSTWLYTGNGSTQTITNGIDLSTKGGLVWIKRRSGTTRDHYLNDTMQGATAFLASNQTTATQQVGGGLTAFSASGFSLGSDSIVNGSSETYASWTFRKQPKFFDVVTYTGNGTAGRTVAHNLGSVPACMIVKRTDDAGNWLTYHTSLGATKYLSLNTTDAQNTSITAWNNTAPTSTVFSVGSNATVNASGGTYVAYLFAHNAGGFGLTGTDNVISCGSVTTDGSGVASVTLGYEPQLVLMKNTQTASDWVIVDNMRGFSQTSFSFLAPNTSSAEGVQTTDKFYPTANGFYRDGLYASQPHIYIAIRRGPMKVPTDATKFFAPTKYTSPTYGVTTTGFPVDMVISANTATSADGHPVADRLRGSEFIYTNTTGAGAAYTINWARQDSFDQDWWGVANVLYSLRRAPSFFDVVCYMGTGVTTNFTHNLGVVPEMIITKKRSNTGPWSVYTSATGNTDYLDLHTNNAVATNTSYYNSTTPTASVFTLGSSTSTNTSSQTYVAYLFATCAGVSKVGSYVGTGTTNQIDCGFTGGARFVMIKRTDNYNADVGNWYVWDSARGIVSGNDPYLFINSTAAEVTNTDYIDPYSAGFEISSTAPNGINQSSANYIFLAIA